MANLWAGILDAAGIILPIPDPIAELNPLVYYKFDESPGATTVVDHGSLGYDLTPTDVTFGTDPVRPTSTGTSATFNGTTSFAVGAGGSVLSSGDYTIGAWIKNRDVNFANIISQYDGSGSGQNGFNVTVYNTGKSFNFASYNTSGGTDASAGTIFSGIDFNTDEPFLVVAVREGNAHRIYVNGLLLASANGTGTVYTTGHNLQIGKDFASSSFLDGDLGEVFILTEALSQYDVFNLYTVGAFTEAPPEHDNFSSADEWDPSGDFTVVYDPTYATLEADEDLEALGDGFTKVTDAPRSIWASFTPTTSGNYGIEVDATPRAMVTVHTGTELSDLVLYDGLPNSNPPGTSYTTGVPMTSGTTYYIRVAPYRYDNGEITITVTPPPPPPANDPWADAIEIDTTTSGSVSGSSAGATMETGEPQTTVNATFGNPFGLDTIWYKFTADATGTIVFTNITHNTALGCDVYHGSAVDALTEDAAGVLTLHGGTHYDLVCTVSVTNGTTYYVQITSIGEDFTLGWTDIT
jgi:hypothetical protein